MFFDCICVWGWPLHSHTHSYIHNGFFRAGQQLGIRTVWLNNEPGIGDDLPSNTLFITEGQVDSYIPIRKDCFYALHNCNSAKYKDLKIISIQCLIAESTGTVFLDKPWLLQQEKSLYMPWATDLLPHEIQKNIDNLEVIHEQRGKEIQFVGYFIPDPWQKAQQYASTKGISFAKVGGYGLPNVSVEENVQRIQRGIISPALQSEEQIHRGYLPCRILKNISYGALGISNNPHIKRLFPEHLMNGIVFGTTIEETIDNGLAATMDFSVQRELMNFVKENHTYVNRLLELQEVFQQFYEKKEYPKENSLSYKPNVLHITFHAGCAADLTNVAEILSWNLDTLMLLKEPQTCNEWYSMNDEVVALFWSRYEERILQADVVIISDTAPLARLFVNRPIKKLIVWVCNRIQYGCTVSSYKAEVEELAKQPWVSYLAYTPFEITYADRLQYDIPWKGTVRPLGKYTNTVVPRNNKVFIGSYHNDSIALDLRSLVKDYVEQAGKKLSSLARYDGVENLKSYDAVIHIPYAASNLALFEALANQIPYLIPSKELMQRLIHKQEDLPYLDSIFVPDDQAESIEWYRYADCFLTFNHFDEIPSLLEESNLENCRARLAAKYKVHKEIVLNQWKHYIQDADVFSTMAPYMENALKPYFCDNTFRKFFGRVPLPRNVTFQEVIRFLSTRTDISILELGTSRSFVDGCFPGCNTDDTKYWEPYVMDRWDWSAGCFTKVMSTVFPNAKITTLDLSPLHLKRCQIMNKNSTNIKYVHASSIDFLRACQETFDLVYMDTGDMTPIQDTANLQLEEAKLIHFVLKNDGILLIDDVHSCVPFQAGDATNPYGKAYLSLPYLLQNKFYMSMDEYQVILRKMH